MNLTKIIWHGLVFFTILGLVGNVQAQPVGGPIFSNGEKELTIGVDGGHFSKKIFGTENDSRRFFLKGSYGIGRLDFFGLVGIVNMELTLADSAQTVLDDGYRIAYGGGATLQLLQFEKLQASLFLTGQFFRFISKPAAEILLSFGGAPASQVLELNYDWREADLSGGISKRIKSIIFYLGASAKIIQRFETKTEKLVFSGQSGVESMEKGEFNSGVLLSPLAGLDIHLPSRLKISMEITARNEQDFAFYLGISQTGKP
ncbi:MAG: hypothetical protein ACE5G1_16680 [bacterium]